MLEIYLIFENFYYFLQNSVKMWKTLQFVQFLEILVKDVAFLNDVFDTKLETSSFRELLPLTLYAAISSTSLCLANLIPHPRPQDLTNTWPLEIGNPRKFD